MKHSLKVVGLIGAASVSLIMNDGAARACGCFTPPDPSVPVVQAGERIVFAVKDSMVEAHIQIQYAGDAKDFGWLLPLPSLPTLELGTDELFTQLTQQTQPKYRLTQANSCGKSSINTSFGGAGGAASPSSAEDRAHDPNNPLVIQDTVGPYDYAVLKADLQQPMLDWLKANHYFVPAGTDAAVVPYINPGAFFLALKLHSGRSAGDLQPVIVRYASDLPMIPIVLTSTAAKPDMGIQVWMLGKGRAIPRNYYHTVINEAAIDWQTSGANYNDLIIRATKEAKERHTFVTEFAGKSEIMKDTLDKAGRFGTRSELAAANDPVSFVTYLQQHGFTVTVQQTQQGGPAFYQPISFSGSLLAILSAAFPMPDQLVQQKLPAAQFYGNFAGYVQQYNLHYTLDATKLADDVWARVVLPTQSAAKLFTTFPYLTRLYTTLSPENMNRDPVFSYNPELADWPNLHQATEMFDCSWTGQVSGAVIKTDSGFTINLPDGVKPAVAIGSLPASLRIEVLREQGKPEVVTDNQASINSALGSSSGCSVAPGSAQARGFGVLSLLGVALAGLIRRRKSQKVAA